MDKTVLVRHQFVRKEESDLRKVPIEYISPGMTLMKTLYRYDGTILLKENTTLNQGLISKIKQIGFNSLYVEDGLLPDIVMKNAISDALRVCGIMELKKAFDFVGSMRFKGTISNEDKLNGIVYDIIAELQKSIGLTIDTFDSRTNDDFWYAHSVNVCVLTCKVLLELKIPIRNIVNIGMGALLHDVGMVKLPRILFTKKDKFSPKEILLVQAHTISGGKLLTCYPVYQRIAMQHHERINGSGYPHQLTKLSQWSQVVGMCDVYDLLISGGINEAIMPNHEAIEMVAASGDYLFDYALTKTFYKNLAPYSPGTLVKLTNGQIAAVVQNYSDNPFLPLVRLLINEDMVRVPQRDIFLEQEKDYRIERQLKPDELLKVNHVLFDQD